MLLFDRAYMSAELLRLEKLCLFENTKQFLASHIPFPTSLITTLKQFEYHTEFLMLINKVLPISLTFS